MLLVRRFSLKSHNISKSPAKFLVNSKLCENHTRKMHLFNQKAFVDGQWVTAKSGNTFEVKNPATGAVVGTVPDMNVLDTKDAINAAHKAFESWQNTTAKERSLILRRWFNLMVKHQDSIAKIMTAESGKPLIEAKGEVNYGNSFVEYYSELARHSHGEILTSSDPSKKILIEKHPIGVVSLITPWNFPHAMITRKASPALAAGCTCVIKPAEDTPFTALALMELAHEAGMPDGVLNCITSHRNHASEVGLELCQSQKVAGLSFTGSTEVGKILYRQSAEGVKRLDLELGGNAPFIVYKSADLTKAVKGAVQSKFRNCGQTCVSANRFLIQQDVLDEFIDKLLTAVKQLKLGNGMQENVNLGPLINKSQFDKISQMVQDAVDKGAKVLLGGKPATNLGELFYEPTVLTDIKPSMKLYQEEVFGPVVTIIPFKSEEDSLKIANDTQRGLAGYFFSEDVSQIFRVAKKLQVGMCGVNEGLISTCEAPFGGIKESGIGREGSHYGLEEFTYVKYICLGGLS